MKYYKYVIDTDMDKEASLKISPMKKFKSMSLGKKVGAGIGVASTGLGVASSVIDGAKELVKPVDATSTVNTGFKNGVMPVNKNITKKASAEHDSLESSKMKYLPAITAAATTGLIVGGVATGKLNKDLLIKEGKKMGRRVSKAYNVGSKVVNEASELAKNNKKTKELKEAFEAYKQKTGNTLMEFGDFKELNSAYNSWLRKTGNSNVSFEDWAKRNAGRVGIENKNYYKGKNIKQKADMALDAAIRGAALGTTTSLANFAVHEVGDEYFKKKDKDEVRARFREDWNNNFADNLVAGKRAERSKSTGYKTPKQRVDQYNRQQQRKYNNNNYRPKYINKVASAPVGDFANHADDMISNASRRLKGKELVKDIIKHDIVKPAVTGVAYIGAPALVAASIKRDRNTLKKIEDTKTDKIVMDVPESAMKKKASYTEKIVEKASKIKKDYIPDNLGQEFVRSGLRGVSMAAPVAIIANRTNKNLRGNLEELEDRNKKLKPVDKGNVRITLERRIDNV